MSNEVIVFPEQISSGSICNSDIRIDVAESSSGAEYRNVRWSRPKKSWSINTGISSVKDFQEVRATFFECQGGLNPFAFKDPTEYTTNEEDPSNPKVYETSYNDQVFGSGDGKTVTFQLTRIFQGITIPVYYPKEGTILIGINGVQTNSGYTIDFTSGQITFTVAPPADSTLSWGGEFYTKARFSNGHISFSYNDSLNGEGNFEVVEVF